MKRGELVLEFPELLPEFLSETLGGLLGQGLRDLGNELLLDLLGDL